MNQIDQLLENYRAVLALPWQTSLSGAERVWFAVYPAKRERELLHRLGDFKLATEQAPGGHRWVHLSLEARFGAWIGAEEYREIYFARPDRATSLHTVFAGDLAESLIHEIDANADSDALVAISGAAALFGIARLSALVKKLEPAVKGRLLVFFPGEYVHNQFRLLDARDGWNYHALALTCEKGKLAL